MSWRVARSLDVLLGQLNRAYPGRSIASDGSIGDAAHATRDSDHNAWYVLDGWGIVTARDYTHDPAHGFDAHALAERLRLSRDRRIKYVISNGRIFAGAAGPSPWTWRTYSGTNPHAKHMHLSVVASRLCDDTTPWAAVTATVLGSRIPDLTSEVDPLSEHMPEIRDAFIAVHKELATIAERAQAAVDTRETVGQLEEALVGPEGVATPGELLKGLRALNGQVAGLTAALQSVAAAKGFDPAAVTAAVEAGVRNVLGSLDNQGA